MGLFCTFVFSGPGRDVSRETILSSAAHPPARAAMFHVKHFCVKAPAPDLRQPQNPGTLALG